LRKFIANLTKDDLELIQKEFTKKEILTPTYIFSKITFENIFDWFGANLFISTKNENFL